jgi:hypothetical protein
MVTGEYRFLRLRLTINKISIADVVHVFYLIQTKINETFMFCPFSNFTRYVTAVTIGTDKY